MTPAQRVRRIRQIDARIDALQAEIRALSDELRPLEIAHSQSLGYRFPPLKGKALIEVMDREDARLRARKEAA